MEYRYIYIFGLVFYADTAAAYVGPGLGLGVIGSVVGVIAAVLLAIVGVIWYPLKRVLKRNKTTAEDDEKSDEL